MTHQDRHGTVPVTAAAAPRSAPRWASGRTRSSTPRAPRTSATTPRRAPTATSCASSTRLAEVQPPRRRRLQRLPHAHDVVGKYMTKADQRLLALVRLHHRALPRADPHHAAQPRLSPRRACRNCHADIVAAIDAIARRTERSRCIRCHDSVGHTDRPQPQRRRERRRPMSPARCTPPQRTPVRRLAAGSCCRASPRGRDAGVAALLVNIFERKQEARNPFYRVVELTDDTDDPAVWGKNFPLQYDGYRRTVDRCARATAAARPCRARRRRPTRARSSRSRGSRRIRG